MYSNYSFDVATLDLNHSRQMIIDMGLTDLNLTSTNQEWRQLALNDPVFVCNFTWNTGNSVRENIGIIVMDNLRNVGINCTPNGVIWADYLNMLYGIRGGSRDDLSLFFIGWMPDYNDPSNYINPLFNNLTSSAQVNDPELEALMLEGIRTTNDDPRRKEIYDRIQELLVEELYPWAYVMVSKGRTTHDILLTNFAYNAMGYLWLFECGWQGDTWNAAFDTGTPALIDYDIPIVDTPPGVPTITTTTQTIAVDNIDLAWTASTGDETAATSYVVYVDDVSEATPTGLTSNIVFAGNGTYVITVAVVNAEGESAKSESITITVAIPPGDVPDDDDDDDDAPPPVIPGYELFTLFAAMGLASLYWVRKNRK